MTQPFLPLKLNGKEVLYAAKSATDQLARLHNVNRTIVGRERMEDVYVVTARAQLPSGRTEESVGAVTIGNLKGDALANALMKCESKAKRRLTLSILGLGMLDEGELETIPLQAQQPLPPIEPVIEMITPSQVKALAILLSDAGLKSTEEGKNQGRDFLSYMVGLEAVESVKALTKDDASRILEALGSGENGSYKADKQKVEIAVEAWAKRNADRIMAVDSPPWDEGRIDQGGSFEDLS